MVQRVRHILSVSKRAAQKFDMETFELKKLNDVKVKEKYQVKISNRLAVLEELHHYDDNDNVDINEAWRSISEALITSAQNY
jgi:hypothetical protein